MTVPPVSSAPSASAYRFLLSRQWVVLTLVALLLIPGMVRLGFWQLHKHEDRVERNELVAESLAAGPVPVGELAAPGRGPSDADRYRRVTATGVYDTGGETVVRQRTGGDGRNIGYHVLTPLVRGDGTAVLVNRGWIPAGDDLTKFPEVPAPPSGEVTVTGRLMADEKAGGGVKDKQGLPPRQVMLIDSARMAQELDRPVLGGYVALEETSPEPSGEQPERLPEPDHSGIGPHLAYAFQWWLFAAAVPVGWVVLVRRERRDRLAGGSGAEDSPKGRTGGETGGGTSPGRPVPTPSTAGAAERPAD
ncbi:SURF1 family protein [Streptomyces verrucosisporus]|uniref:SURF1 family cytochrome oxidase biogenesis protein n=1 Tax=Streptomyces verrucosisporus TaxID=1695161 RepID=UPI0019D13B96|nr:SURF1 family protein [Streptomyces verrucosisporus]MBN3928556.1 SURF1 family protein [Streptomyces verrucosisporus]